jgi:hypothetical protein
MTLSQATQASTMTQVVYPLAQPSEAIELDDLLLQDGLGYTCIAEAQIDVAFFASGKGARLPQTCLPEPCTAALTQAGLGELIGRAPTIAEWDDYYARYAETCRAETTAFGTGPADTLPQSTTDFWTPILVGATPLFDRVVSSGLGTPSGAGSNGLGTFRSRNSSNPFVVFGGGGSSGSSSTSDGGAGISDEEMLVSSDSSTSASGGDAPGGGIQGSSLSDGGGGSGGGNDGGGGSGGNDSGGGSGGSDNGGGGSGGGGSGYFDDDGPHDDSSWSEDGDVPAVPLPNGVWLALSGIATLGGMKLRQRSRKT